MIVGRGEVIALRWFGGSSAEQVVQIPVDQIKVNPYQPRRHFDEASLEDLAASIREVGVIQPIVVRRLGNTYELIAGERRLRASILIGLKTIPGLVREYTDREVAQTALIENLQRQDLNPLEEATAFQTLIAEFGIRQDELAARLGKSQSTIANKLRLLNLAEPVQELLRNGELNERQARALLRVKEPDAQLTLAEAAVEQGLNVRQTEALVEQHLAGESAQEVAAAARHRPLRRFIPKDVRIFLNTIKDATNLMKKAGIAAEVVEEEADGYLSVTVRIPKRQ
jgi:ParB family chromosome partitioning protein